MNPSTLETLASALAAAGSLASPSKIHGYVAGSCCAAGMPDAAGLYEPLAAHLELQPGQLAALLDLGEWVVEAEASLSSPDLAFYPLLPDDDDGLVERALALGQWCEGFLAGYAVGLGRDGRTPGAETQEILSDLVAISRIGTPDDDDSSETDFMELVEYLRMAAMNLFLEARNPPHEASPAPSLH